MGLRIKRWVKTLLLMVVAVLVLGSIGLFFYDKPLFFIFGQHEYEYHHFCLENSDHCITVITYSPPSLGDNPFKRYVVFGNGKYKAPPQVNYIEFPNDTGLAITWLSENECRIVSNGPPQKEMKLSADLNVEIIYSNALYEKTLSENPEHDVVTRPGKVFMKKGEIFTL